MALWICFVSGEVLTTSEVESIQNRACRTLGNLSLDSECCKAVHTQEELLPMMAELFAKASENDTKLTFARTLRLVRIIFFSLFN